MYADTFSTVSALFISQAVSNIVGALGEYSVMKVGQSDPGGVRADGAHRTVEPVGCRIVLGAAVQVVRDATQLLEVEAVHVSLRRRRR